MSRYAVALHLIKQLQGGIENTSIRLNVVEAVLIEEAIGKELIAIKSSDYRLGAYRAMEITEHQTKTTMKNLFKLVQQWVIDRNLHTQDPRIQMCKVMEEVGELAKAVIRDDMPNIKDGIGDSIVTLICLGAQKGLDAEECLAAAYDVIKDRKGKLVDGVFIKEEDLKNG